MFRHWSYEDRWDEPPRDTPRYSDDTDDNDDESNEIMVFLSKVFP